MIKRLWHLFVGRVAFGGPGVIKWLWVLFWWECSYWLGWCDQMFMGTMSVGVLLLVGLV